MYFYSGPPMQFLSGVDSLPRFHCRVGLHIVLFEDCSAFTHVAACTLAQSPYIVTAIRGLQTFRHLHACPGCFRRERSPGGPCTHWKSAALSRRTWFAVIRIRQARYRAASACERAVEDPCKSRYKLSGATAVVARSSEAEGLITRSLSSLSSRAGVS